MAIVACLYGVNWCLKRTEKFNLVVMNDAKDQRRMTQYLMALILLQGSY